MLPTRHRFRTKKNSSCGSSEVVGHGVTWFRFIVVAWWWCHSIITCTAFCRSVGWHLCFLKNQSAATGQCRVPGVGNPCCKLWIVRNRELVKKKNGTLRPCDLLCSGSCRGVCVGWWCNYTNGVCLFVLFCHLVVCVCVCLSDDSSSYRPGQGRQPAHSLWCHHHAPSRLSIYPHLWLCVSETGLMCVCVYVFVWNDEIQILNLDLNIKCVFLLYIWNQVQ